MPLRVLMFGWEYPPNHLGGLGVACHGLVQGLSENNICVTLVLPFYPQDRVGPVEIRSLDPEVFKGVRIASLLSPYDNIASYAKRLQHLPREMQELYGGDLAAAVDIYTQLAVELTKDLHPDIIHCHDWMTYEAGKCAAEYHNVPLVAHIHATEFDRTGFHPNEWIYEREKYGFKQADLIIAVSKYTKDILVHEYDIPQEKIAVVHNASHSAYSQNPDTQKDLAKLHQRSMVLFLGRLTIQKGTWHFLEMAQKIHMQRPDVLFVIAGDGDMLDELIDRSCVLGLEECVLFTGKVDSDEAEKLYEQADCFVMPSVSEPFGLVALEAAAHGTPLILSKQSGAAEVIDHAFKVDFWDTDKMADCVLTILREKPLAQQLTNKAGAILKHLTWRNHGQAVRGMYDRLIANAQKSPHQL